MTIFNPQPSSQTAITTQVTQKLLALRNALDAIENLYGWTSGLAVADLTPLGFTTADAQSILNAVADANAVAEIYETGLPPSGYPQPASAYVYSASQRVIMEAL